jgi:hypothetical protein
MEDDGWIEIFISKFREDADPVSSKCHTVLVLQACSHRNSKFLRQNGRTWLNHFVHGKYHKLPSYISSLLSDACSKKYPTIVEEHYRHTYCTLSPPLLALLLQEPQTHSN